MIRERPGAVALACSFLWILLTAGSISAGEVHKVAVIEFQNKAGRIISENLWTMAEDLGKYLKKADRSFQVVKRKDVLNLLGELTWDGDRLAREQETKLAVAGIDYVIYGAIAQWQARGTIGAGSGDYYAQSGPRAVVAFALEIVNPANGQMIKSFGIDGVSTGQSGRIVSEDPVEFDETRYEDQIYDARDIALRKAAVDIAEVLVALR